MALGYTNDVSSNDLNNISILLDKNNDLEKEITHLFNKESIFIFTFYFFYFQKKKKKDHK